MSNQIKIVPDLQPWEVMKRAGEGEPLCIKAKGSHGSFTECNFMPGWNWCSTEYAIIDTTTSQIKWDDFNWEFFEQYGGLTCYTDRVNSTVTHASYDYIVANSLTPIGIKPSPFYYWPGGAQPVPGNVEVMIIGRSGAAHRDSAMELLWDHTGKGGDIIAFRITGEIA